MGQCAVAEVADVSEFLLICAARRRQRGFVITMCMAFLRADLDLVIAVDLRIFVSEKRDWGRRYGQAKIYL